MRWHPKLRRGAALLALALGLCFTLGTTAAKASLRPGAETILRRADLVRNPYLGIALDLELSVVDRSSGWLLRSSHHTLLTHRNGRTLLLMGGEAAASPGAVLIAEESYWLLLPRAEHPVELPFRLVVAGDLSHAGFLRVNLRVLYEPRYDGEEALASVPCWRLVLLPKDGSAPFGRVIYWVAQDGFLPLRIEFYGKADDLLKTARFVSYQETGVGLRPARIEIEDTLRPEERTTLILGKPAGANTSGLRFDLEDLAALREAARNLGETNLTAGGGRHLIGALRTASAKRGELP